MLTSNSGGLLNYKNRGYALIDKSVTIIHTVPALLLRLESYSFHSHTSQPNSELKKMENNNSHTTTQAALRSTSMHALCGLKNQAETDL